MVATPRSDRLGKHGAAALGAALIATLFLTYVRTCIVPDGCDIGTDAYYHVTMGRLFPDVWRSKTFPWTRMSVWEDCFYDKEWGYHLILSSLAGWQRSVSSEAGPPYHLFFAATALLLFCCFGYALRRLAGGNVWFWVIVLPFVSPYFLYRVLLVRPHTVAIGLFALATSLALSERSNAKGRLGLFLLGVAFSYCYSNPHLMLLPILVRMACDLARKRKAQLVDLLAAVCGLVAGLALHPQFPNTFRLWWVQCVHVVAEILSQSEGVALGKELFRPSLGEILSEAHLYGILAVHVALFIRLRRGRMPPVALYLLVLESVTLFGFLLSKRTIEYAVPCMVMTSCVLWSAHTASPPATGPRRRCSPAVAAWALWTGLALYSLPACIRRLPAQAMQPGYAQLGSFVRRTIPPGATIGNLNWSHFPMLFQALPDYRFLVGLDPYFGLAADTQRMTALERYRNSEQVLSPRQLFDIVGTRYVFVSRRSRGLLRKLYGSGIVGIYQGTEGDLFDLVLSEQLKHPPTSQ